MAQSLRDHGVGVAFRRQMAGDLLRSLPDLDCFELLADSFLGRPDAARALAAARPVLMHSVNLSIGTAVVPEYLERMKELARASRTAWWSDHLGYTRAAGVEVGHFLPVPFTDESLDRVARNVKLVERALGVPFAFENVTASFVWPNDTMDEPTFIRELLRRTGSWLLLDVENLRINAANHGFDPYAYLDAIPLDRVLHVHVAGGEHDGQHVDTHSAPVPEETWALLAHVCGRARPRAVVLERDQDFPPREQLVAEVQRARSVVRGAAA